jgi:SAM-dependent methyltransferase
MVDQGVVTEDEPWYLSTNEKSLSKEGSLKTNRGTEDIHFCNLASKVGVKILVDTSVLAGHLDPESGIMYGLPPDCAPIKRARWLAGDKTDEDKKYRAELKALDLGAGDSRRVWPGYKTYTTDIRADTKPDYVMDTRLLNLPDEHFDLVASSHHLEHIGRWDQEKVWQEMFRILKPGGRMEHVVPDVSWAARKIVDGDVDADSLNVLYGAQESHGYERDYNTHYMGYTKAIGIALAESCGLKHVQARNYEDDPDLGYNLVITGTKPEELVTEPEVQEQKPVEHTYPPVKQNDPPVDHSEAETLLAALTALAGD